MWYAPNPGSWTYVHEASLDDCNFAKKRNFSVRFFLNQYYFSRYARFRGLNLQNDKLERRKLQIHLLVLTKNEQKQNQISVNQMEPIVSTHMISSVRFLTCSACGDGFARNYKLKTNLVITDRSFSDGSALSRNKISRVLLIISRWFGTVQKQDFGRID